MATASSSNQRCYTLELWVVWHLSMTITPISKHVESTRFILHCNLKKCTFKGQALKWNKRNHFFSLLLCFPDHCSEKERIKQLIRSNYKCAVRSVELCVAVRLNEPCRGCGGDRCQGQTRHSQVSGCVSPCLELWQILWSLQLADVKMQFSSSKYYW